MKKKVKPSVEGVECLLLIADTHCGSKLGLLPPDCHDLDGKLIQQSPYQQWTWSCWERAIAGAMDYIGNRTWALLVNGDVIEGDHHGTVEVVDPDDTVHYNIAVRALLPLADKADAVMLVEGTECHTHSVEYLVGEKLGAVKEPVTGASAFKQVQFTIRDVLCHAKHHMPVSLRPWTETSAWGAMLVKEQAEAAAMGHPIPNVVIRSHRHKGGHCALPGGVFVATYPWQGITRHARKVTQSSIVPIGLQVLDFSKLDNYRRPEVKEFSYCPDPDPVLKL